MKSLAAGERADGVVSAIAQDVLRASEQGSYLGSELQLSEQQALAEGGGGGCDGGPAAAGAFRPVPARQQASAEALASAYAGRGGGGAQELANNPLASATDTLFCSDNNLFAAAVCGTAAGASPGVGVRPLTEADQVLLNMLQRLLYELMDAVPDAEGDAEDSDPGACAGAGAGGIGDALAGAGPSGGGPPARAVPECEHSPEAFLRITDAFIRRFIKFCKCLPEFAVLPQDDQIALLKVFNCLFTCCTRSHGVAFPPHKHNRNTTQPTQFGALGARLIKGGPRHPDLSDVLL